MQRLSSGLRINNASDDAAGYAISQGLTAQVNGLDQAGRNVGDAVSMVQTAESSMNNIQSMLQRVRELAVQYQNGSLQASDKTAIQGEVDQLTNEIKRQRGSVAFNGSNLLDGSAGTSGVGVTFQVGANAADTLTASFGDIQSSMATGFDWTSTARSSACPRSGPPLWATWTPRSTTCPATRPRSARSRTACSTRPTRHGHRDQPLGLQQPHQGRRHGRRDDQDDPGAVLQQAGTSMLAQANAAPQMVLKLLG